MVNPAAMMKLMSAKNKFQAAHPKFVKFLSAMVRQGITEETVIEMTVTRPDGTSITGNMKVQASDLELFEELKNMSGN